MSMAIDDQGEESKIPENQGDSAPVESAGDDVGGEEENREADVESEDGLGDGEDKGEKEDEDEDDKDDEDEQELDREEEKQSVGTGTFNERPTRERKIVKRYFPPPPVSRSSATRPLLIPKGSGTVLKDIPNVAYKLSKRKPDDNLQLLHTILYGKKAKVHNLKKDIGLFSGFLWIENEEKQRSKVKEKLDKCVKEKLLDFCDVLNIPVNRAIIKKEDISAKLLEFLQSPHATTDVSLADREQKGKKRKLQATPIKSSSSKERSAEKSSKKAKHSEKQKETSKDEEESEDEDKHESSDVKDESMDEDGDKKAPKEESDEDEINSEEGDESKEQMPSPKSEAKSGSKSSKTPKDIKKHSPEKPSESNKKSRRTAKKSDAAEKDSASAPPVKGSRSKKQKPEIETKEAKPADQKDSSGKQSGQLRLKPLVKKEGKGKASKKKNAEPSKEELRDVVDKILKEVDFKTATLSDILRQIGTHFGLNLGHRKAEVKEIITEVISNMSDAEDEDDEEEGSDDDDEDGKNGEKDKEADDDNA